MSLRQRQGKDLTMIGGREKRLSPDLCPLRSARLRGARGSRVGGVGAILRAASDVVAQGHAQPIPIFQQLARSDPSGRNDVRAVPTIAAKRRGSLGGARDRHQP